MEPSEAKKDALTLRETPPPGPGEGVGGGVNLSPKGKKGVGRREDGRAKSLTPERAGGIVEEGGGARRRGKEAVGR